MVNYLENTLNSIKKTQAPQMNKLKREDHATKSAPDQQEPTSSTSKQKYDPLNMFREIYLDHDSKTITMLLPSGQESGKHCVDKNYINCTSHNCD